MMKSRALPLVIALAAALGAPSLAAESPGGAAPAAKPGRACFLASNADGFSAKDDHTVYVRSGVRDVFELTLFQPCIDIDWALHIGLRSRGSDFICEGNNVDVQVISPSPIGHQHCEVTAVRKLTPEQVAALPKKDRP